LHDLDWSKGTLRLIKSKVGRERLLPLPQRLGKAVASYLRHGRPTGDQAQVFLCHHFPYGTPLSTGQIGYVIRKAYDRAGLPVTRTHLLRHSFATNLHQQGASVKALADVLGHQSLESTTIYTRVNLQRNRSQGSERLIVEFLAYPAEKAGVTLSTLAGCVRGARTCHPAAADRARGSPTHPPAHCRGG
jgi:site-specific recombinase XerD